MSVPIQFKLDIHALWHWILFTEYLLMDFGAIIWSLSILSVCWPWVLSYRINGLRGGTSALQNLQRTICFLLLAGTSWSLLHLGHVRLRLSIVLITTLNIGFINFPPFHSVPSEGEGSLQKTASQAVS